MIELTLQEKLEYAQKIRKDFRIKVYDLDFTMRYNLKSLILHSEMKNNVELLNATLKSEMNQTMRLIDFIDEDIKQFENLIKLEPLEKQFEGQK